TLRVGAQCRLPHEPLASPRRDRCPRAARDGGSRGVAFTDGSAVLRAVGPEIDGASVRAGFPDAPAAYSLARDREGQVSRSLYVPLGGPRKEWLALLRRAGFEPGSMGGSTVHRSRA